MLTLNFGVCKILELLVSAWSSRAPIFPFYSIICGTLCLNYFMNQYESLSLSLTHTHTYTFMLSCFRCKTCKIEVLRKVETVQK